MAAAYRHRPVSAVALDHASRAVGGIREGAAALDIGGGPGGHAARWAELGYRAIVVDPAEAMLLWASTREGVEAVRAASQALPFREASVSLAYFHLSLHYDDWPSAIREAVRVLEPGGRCAIWTLGPEHHRTSMLARWFPSVPVIDAGRFPPPVAVQELLHSLGAATRAVREVERISRRAGDWQRAVEAGFVSTLQLVDPAELEEGLRAFTSSHPDPAEEVVYEMKWESIVGVVPGP